MKVNPKPDSKKFGDMGKGVGRGLEVARCKPEIIVFWCDGDDICGALAQQQVTDLWILIWKEV